MDSSSVCCSSAHSLLVLSPATWRLAHVRAAALPLPQVCWRSTSKQQQRRARQCSSRRHRGWHRHPHSYSKCWGLAQGATHGVGTATPLLACCCVTLHLVCICWSPRRKAEGCEYGVPFPRLTCVPLLSVLLCCDIAAASCVACVSCCAPACLSRHHQALPTSDPDEADSQRLALLPEGGGRSSGGEISQRRSNSSGNLPAKG